jgi:hypothetical protein
MVRAPRSQRPPRGRDFERAAVPARLPSDPIVDVARAHGYKHAQPQRTRQMPLASNASAVDETGARECRGAHPWGWGPTLKSNPPWPASPRQQPSRIPLRVKGARLPTVAGRNLAAVVVLLPTRGLFKRARAPQPPSRRWS